jgi:hypothetical protein
MHQVGLLRRCCRRHRDSGRLQSIFALQLSGNTSRQPPPLLTHHSDAVPLMCLNPRKSPVASTCAAHAPLNLQLLFCAASPLSASSSGTSMRWRRKDLGRGEILRGRPDMEVQIGCIEDDRGEVEKSLFFFWERGRGKHGTLLDTANPS